MVSKPIFCAQEASPFFDRIGSKIGLLEKLFIENQPIGRASKREG
jgi:hypothetical protein